MIVYDFFEIFAVQKVDIITRESLFNIELFILGVYTRMEKVLVAWHLGHLASESQVVCLLQLKGLLRLLESNVFVLKDGFKQSFEKVELIKIVPDLNLDQAVKVEELVNWVEDFVQEIRDRAWLEVEEYKVQEVRVSQKSQ